MIILDFQTFNLKHYILCKPMFDTAYIEKHLEGEVSTEEKLKRLYHPDEEKNKEDYMNNLQLFDVIINNNYDDYFLANIKQFLSDFSISTCSDKSKFSINSATIIKSDELSGFIYNKEQ